MSDLTPEARRLRTWQGVTLGALFVGYAGYYLCRSNLSVATPLILEEYHDAGVTKKHIGDITSLGLLAYAIGKLLFGSIPDYVGGRRVFLFGLFGAVICTLAFAAAPLVAGPFAPIADWWNRPAAVLVPFALVWFANRLVQSMGWGGLIQLTGRWFPAARVGTVMGILSMSYLLGDAVAREFLGRLIDGGFDWQEVFVVSAAILSGFGVAVFFLLKSGPKAVGLPEFPPPPDNVYGSETERVPWQQLIWPLMQRRAFWLVCGMSFGMTLIRETLSFWTPQYLKEVAGLTAGEAARASLVVPLAGAMAVLWAGWRADRIGSRFGRVAVVNLAGLVGVFGLLATVNLSGRPVMTVCMLAAAAALLLAPYSFCAGALSLKLGGQKGGSTAAGLIDTAGYFGAILSGSVVARIAEAHNWATVFAALAVVALGTLAIAAVFSRAESPLQPAAAGR